MKRIAAVSLILFAAYGCATHTLLKQPAASGGEWRIPTRCSAGPKSSCISRSAVLTTGLKRSTKPQVTGTPRLRVPPPVVVAAAGLTTPRVRPTNRGLETRPTT